MEFTSHNRRQVALQHRPDKENPQDLSVDTSVSGNVSLNAQSDSRQGLAVNL